GEDLAHLIRLGNDVHAAKQGLGYPAHLGNLPVDAHAAAVALEFAGYTSDRVRQLLRRLIVVLTVGQQDRVPLHQLRHGVEEPAGEGEPGAHSRATVRAELIDRLMCGSPRSAVHEDHAPARAY